MILMTILKKIVRKISGYLPVTRKTYNEEISAILDNFDLVVTAIEGFKLAERQLSTINMQIIERLGEMEQPKVKKENIKKDEHVEFG